MALPRAHAPPSKGHNAGAQRLQLCSSAATRGPEDELSINNKFPGLTCCICLMWSNRFPKRMSEASKLRSLFLICSCGAIIHINLPAIVVSRISVWMTESNPSFPFLFPGWVKTERHRWGVPFAPNPFPLTHYWTVFLNSPMSWWKKDTDNHQTPHFHWHLKVKSPCIVHNDISLPHVWKGRLWELLEGGGNLWKFTGEKGLDLVPFCRNT